MCEFVKKKSKTNKEKPKVYVKSGKDKQIWTICKCTKHLEDWPS